MKKYPAILAAGALALCIPLLAGHGAAADKPGTRPPPKKTDKLAELMRSKLKNAEKVLEGVAVGDFRKIRSGADELMIISKTTEFQVIRSSEYEVRANAFRRSVGNLIKNAKDKDLDAAALSYVEMTLTCVRCHKHVREVRMTRRD